MSGVKLNGHGYRFSTVGLAAILLFGLASCKAFVKEEPPFCPRVSILDDAATITKFASITRAAGADISAIKSFRAKLTSYRGSCSYDSSKKIMNVTIAVSVEAERTESFVGNDVDLNYFIAIPAFYPDPNGKKIIPISVKFSGEEMTQKIVAEEQFIAMPVHVVKDMGKYEIFLGWQLDGNELKFNRAKSGTINR